MTSHLDRLKRILLGVTAGGAVAFAAGLLLGEAQRTWQIYFVNFLFWSGIAQGGVVMSGVYRITNARWGDQFSRIGEGMVSFLPVSFILYCVLVVGGGRLFPWLEHHYHGKELWLSGPYLFGRDGIVFLFLMWLSARYVSISVRPDLGLRKENTGEKGMSWWEERIARKWRGWDIESAESAARLSRLTPALLVSFAILYSLIGFDLVMALDPEWFSTLFGWLYFVHAFFGALAGIAVLAVLSRRWFGISADFTTKQWHDMGKLVFGFCLLSGGFFWSQFLVIWYGNLPEETSYLITRFYSDPWEPLMWVYIILAYLLPLAVFLSRRVKEVPGGLLAISSLILAALFLERFLAVVPFVWKGNTIPFGVIEVFVSAGFGGLFVLCWLAFFSRIPIIPASMTRGRGRSLTASAPGV